MIKPEQIPNEVIEAAVSWLPDTVDRQPYLRAAIAAAINSWPGMGLVDVYEDATDLDINELPEPDYIRVELPLSKEEKA